MTGKHARVIEPMYDPIADEESIATARSRYNARKTTSPLIVWICSDEWSDVGQWLAREGEGDMSDRGPRGTIHRSDEYPCMEDSPEYAYSGDHFSGEISCK